MKCLRAQGKTVERNWMVILWVPVVWGHICACEDPSAKSDIVKRPSGAIEERGEQSGSPRGATSGSKSNYGISVRVVPETPVNGQLALFFLYAGKKGPTMKTAKGTFGSRLVSPAKWSTDGRVWLMLGAVPIGTKAKSLALRVQGTMADESKFAIEKDIALKRVSYPEEKIEVESTYVEPPAGTKERVAREKRSIAGALSQATRQRFWRGNFVRPTQSPETSAFGIRRVYNDKKQSRHLGLDLDGEVGDPVLSTQRGRVALVEERYYSGLTIVLNHGYGLFSMYFHLSQTFVQKDDMVEASEKIGAMGKSGRVTGPHLHFAIKANGVYVDPKQLLDMDFSEDPLAPRKQ